MVEAEAISSNYLVYDPNHGIYHGYAVQLGSLFEPALGTLLVKLHHSGKIVKFVLDDALVDFNEIVGWLYFPDQEAHPELNYAIAVWNR